MEKETIMTEVNFIDIDEEIKFIKKHRRFVPKFIIHMILDTDAYFLQERGILTPPDLKLNPVSFYLKFYLKPKSKR